MVVGEFWGGGSYFSVGYCRRVWWSVGFGCCWVSLIIIVRVWGGGRGVISVWVFVWGWVEVVKCRMFNGRGFFFGDGRDE